MIKVEKGDRFGRLTVVEELPPRSVPGGTKRMFALNCDCGNRRETMLHNLRQGYTQSCGCLQRELAAEALRRRRTKPKGEAAFNVIVRHYKDGAKRRGLAFDLTPDECRVLFQNPCHYCGQPPSNVMKLPQLNGSFVYNGIDRLTNEEGYVLENCVSCCIICNKAKRTSDSTTFKAWIARAYKHLYTEDAYG